MEPLKIDLIHPDQVIKELFEDDRWVKDEFAKHLAAEPIWSRPGPLDRVGAWIPLSGERS
jgi:hypothetical protein